MGHLKSEDYDEDFEGIRLNFREVIVVAKSKNDEMFIKIENWNGLRFRVDTSEAIFFACFRLSSNL